MDWYRLLRWWICHPLADVDAIEARLEAVDDFLSSDELCRSFDLLARVPDLERKLSRIRAWAQQNDRHLGVSEGAAALRRAAQELVAALDGFEELERFRLAIVSQLSNVTSPLLRKTILELPNLGPTLITMLEYFDDNVARVSRSIVLRPGCCEEYDRAREDKVRAWILIDH
jgi:DNA mismatch repair protein MSH6